MWKFVWVALGLLVLSTPAWAAGFDDAATQSWLKGGLKGLLVGTIVGFLISCAGFWKDSDTAKKWDFQKAMPTILFGAAVGLISGWDQKDIADLEGLKDNAANVIVAELLGKVAYRNGAPQIGKIVSTLMGKGTV